MKEGVRKFRPDIQALRGVAIVLVLLYHAQIGGLSAGYLGVDIFFVISGYLITGLIGNGIDRGDFRLSEFYLRRVKRLLPAALVVLTAVTLATPWFLLSSEATNYLYILLGSLTFSANIALWLQNGYFEQAAHLKPLLHMWSLAIEEQYYLFWPSLLLFTPRRYWLAGVSILTAASLLLCLAYVNSKPGATFYLLPTRAWELGVGSIAALIPLGRMSTMTVRGLFWPALAALLVVPTFVVIKLHPGPYALVVCISTAILILRCHPVLNGGALVAVLAFLGNISYSLYLVHWPLIAFANSAYVSGVPSSIRAALLLMAIALAVLMYRFVENPLHRYEGMAWNRIFLSAATATFGLALLAVGTARFSRTELDFKVLRRPNPGLLDCDQRHTFDHPEKCSTSKSPTLMIWGDSYAEHLVLGIDATTKQGIVQATRSACGPYLGMAQLRFPDLEWPWAKDCIAFNDSVLGYLRSNPSIETVVLASDFKTYWDDTNSDVRRILFRNGGRFFERPRSIDATMVSLLTTITAVRKLDRKVVLVAPPPASNYDIGECVEREQSGRIFVLPSTATEKCALDRNSYLLASADQRDFFQKLKNFSEIEVVNIDQVLCSESSCATTIEGIAVYGFHNHLSVDGSIALAKKMKLGTQIERLAK
ncbi:acyltransferase family protein [Thermomonas sp.]|uniref:acyltransferase family protein n=1 Tax=Thermomonas sp. TaxID=1971895 RepID=UPI002489B212|nr:acyltransferase family protein [Thermomonas sp.]MDI1253495.1 acyltransferase family protein [Thermomonas sp.]